VTLVIGQFLESRAKNAVLTTTKALEAVLAEIETFDTETISANKAAGRVLQQIVQAERSQPPFDRVMMDGIALSWNDFSDGQLTFPIQAMQAAGDQALSLQVGHCIEIMTGASLPNNADCIVPIEQIHIANGFATINADYELKKKSFIHPCGSDFEKGAHLLIPGKRISPLDIAIIASCGKTEVIVAKDPVIRVISTGNELVAAGNAIEAHQIRMSNGPAMVSLLKSHNYKKTNHDHIIDDISELRNRLAEHLDEAEVIILSGGVSMGKTDYIPQVLKDLKVKVIFHKVSQRPGKPMWFGRGSKGQMVFALPGNPVSALVCCRQYVIAALSSASGASEGLSELAVIESDISFKPELTFFLPVKLISNISGQVLAMPVKTNTSGDFASLSATDGYIELAKNQTHFSAGTAVPLHRWIAR
jgi:molybdopterin molybdotransferase